MNCCVAETRHHMGDLGCEQLDVAMEDLRQLLESAKSQGLLITHWFTADEGDPVAVSAQATYNGVSRYAALVIGDASCASHTAEAQQAAANLRGLLGGAPQYRPDFTPPPSALPSLPGLGAGIPSWVPFVLVGGVVLYGASMALQFVPKRRYAGYRRRR